MLPEGAVRQKMVRLALSSCITYGLFLTTNTFSPQALEKFTPEEIDKFFADTDKYNKAAAAAATKAEPAPEAKQLDPKFNKYKIMKKNLPEEVLRHKMKADGLTASEIDEFFAFSDAPAPSPSGGDSQGGGGGSALMRALGGGASAVPQSVLEKLESDLKKYMRLATSVQRGALMRKMEQDGHSQEIIAAFLLECYKDQKGDEKAPTQSTGPQKKEVVEIEEDIGELLLP